MTELGKLYVFEGPDGVGKTTIAQALKRDFDSRDIPCDYIAFPGREPGSLGHHVYELHHEPDRFGIAAIGGTSLQLLHVAAHIDAIERRITPALQAGRHIVLDRFWWSTWVYGLAEQVNAGTLHDMIDIEKQHWGSIMPTMLFLVKRSVPIGRDANVAEWLQLLSIYENLALDEVASYPVRTVKNESTIEDVVARICSLISE